MSRGLLLWAALGADAFALAAEPAPVEEAELRLLSLNIWGVPFPVSKPFHRRRDTVVDFIEESDPDAVLMQEAFKNWVNLRWLREALGGEHHFVRAEDEQGRKVARKDSGLVTVHRGEEPPEGHRNELLELCCKNYDEVLADKGVQRFDLLADNGVTVPVFNLHLIAGDVGFRREPRQQQVVQMLGEMVQQTEGPAVLVGDFNLAPPTPADCTEDALASAPEWRLDCETEALIRDAGFRDVAVELASAGGSTLQSTYADGEARYDRVYVRDGAEVCLEPVDLTVHTHLVDGEEKPKRLSDHKPLLVDLLVTPCGTAVASRSEPSPG